MLFLKLNFGIYCTRAVVVTFYHLSLLGASSPLSCTSLTRSYSTSSVFMTITEHVGSSSFVEVDHAYLASKPFIKFFRSVLLQVLLFSLLSFVGPSIFDGFSNIGGGGLSTPYLANLAITLNYVCGFLVTLFGGPLINKLGIKWSSFISALTFPLVGSGYYVSSRYGVDSYLLVATSLNGLTAGFCESKLSSFFHNTPASCCGRGE